MRFVQIDGTYSCDEDCDTCEPEVQERCLHPEEDPEDECNYDCEHCRYYHDPCFYDILGGEEE